MGRRYTQLGDPPTDRQQVVLDFIRAYHREHGRPATVRQIMAHLGLRNHTGAMVHITALVKKGYVRKSSNPSMAGNSGHYLPVVARGHCPSCGQAVPKVSATN